MDLMLDLVLTQRFFDYSCSKNCLSFLIIKKDRAISALEYCEERTDSSPTLKNRLNSITEIKIKEDIKKT